MNTTTGPAYGLFRGTRARSWEQLFLRIMRSISLPESSYEKLEGHYAAIAELLTDPTDPELKDLYIFPQGSVQTRTLVRPLPGAEADVDAVAFKSDGTSLTPREFLDRLLAELEARARTQGDVTRKRRCVTVSYADKDLPAHVDITPAVPSAGNTSKDGTGPLVVPDYPSNEMKPTNPKDFALWVMSVSKVPFPLEAETTRMAEAVAKAEVEPMPDHKEIVAMDPLRLAIKLCKRHRDLYARRCNCADHQPISVLITTLVGKAYLTVAAAARANQRSFTMLEAIQAIVDRMPHEFDEAPPMAREWRLENPRRSDENFAEKWNLDPKYAAVFDAWHADLKWTLALGLEQFADRGAFEQEVGVALGIDSRLATHAYLTAAAKAGDAMPGLSDVLAKRLHDGERAVGTLLGLAASAPIRAQEPTETDRLG